MASRQVLELLEQAKKLTPGEQLELALQLVEKARRAYEELTPDHSHKWSDIKGKAPHLLAGEGAQEWVSRTRHESDACLS